MTEFEQQVAEALASKIATIKSLNGFAHPTDWELASGLAPVIVAAIQRAAIRGCNVGVMEPDLPNGLDSARQEGLAAIRGDLR